MTKKNILTNHDLIDKLNNATDDPESEMLSSQMKWQPYLKTNKHFSFFHLNISSLPFHLRTLYTYHWTQLELWFSWNIRVSLKNQNTLTSVHLPGYNIEYTPTECKNGGTLLYVKKVIN